MEHAILKQIKAHQKTILYLSMEILRLEELISKGLDISVEELELSVRSANCFRNAGIENVNDILKLSESDALKIKNFGRKNLNEIRDLFEEDYGIKVLQ
tara:strand:+ start:1602 stop:1898 length:297 start_codon:yes stop_codon:yes gene_type:complete